MSNYFSLLLIVGGAFHLFFAFFHAAFWRFKFLNWQEELPRMSPINQAVFQMLNVAVIVFMLLIGYISIRFSYELPTTELGKVLLLGTVFFWIARLVGEFTLKDKTLKPTPKLIIAFIIIILIYILPLIL